MFKNDYEIEVQTISLLDFEVNNRKFIESRSFFNCSTFLDLKNKLYDVLIKNFGGAVNFYKVDNERKLENCVLFLNKEFFKHDVLLFITIFNEREKKQWKE